MSDQGFTDDQKRYLEGFAAGSGIAQSVSRALPVLPTFAAALGVEQQVKPRDEEQCVDVHRVAQDRFLAEGKKLSAEEQAKRKSNGLDLWDQVMAHARDGRFPKGTDVFLFKFQGLFYVSPAQDAFMCRLRIPGGILGSHQLHGVADLAAKFGGGYADVTTRANLQIREISPRSSVDLLMGLAEIGIIPRGAGADNIRNITACPTAGFDPQELIDTRPLVRELQHYITNHRELYGLPRKFNIAFDGGGVISALDDTNDIGFAAVRVVEESAEVRASVYFRMRLAGITGHRQFASDAGVLMRPEECVEVAAAVVRVFIEHGDRTDRKKARLKYLIDRWGMGRFLAEVEKSLGRDLRKCAIENCEPAQAAVEHAHVGIHPQNQAGLHYVGVVLPVGRMTSRQMHRVAEIADRYAGGSVRLTVWQNLLIPDVATAWLPMVRHELRRAGLDCEASSVRAGLVACTGSAGCKYAAANTKKHALELGNYLDGRIALDQPVNIHFTGCHHSCAQHYIGDIGLLATKVAIGEEMVEGYHIFVGGGYGANQSIGREIFRDIVADDVPAVVEGMLQGYLEHRDDGETFGRFVRRHETDPLRKMFQAEEVEA